jgi:hypothetical protein
MGHTGEAKWCPEASRPQSAEAMPSSQETRGPTQSGRAPEGAKNPDEVNGSRPRECRAFAFAFRGIEVLLQQKV